MRSIGGYFGLELGGGKEYHVKALRLNTGRNAFEYILRTKQYRKVYMPYYTCDVLLEPLHKLEIEFVYYHVNASLEAEFNFDNLQLDEALLYTNYFGIKTNYAKNICIDRANIIIDNAQAFYAMPEHGIDTFYSPRKFFGVADGSYLYTDKLLGIVLDKDESALRYNHVLTCTDQGAEKGYLQFLKAEKELSNNSIREMSELTQRVLDSIDYSLIAEKRRANFKYLADCLHNINKFHIDLDNNDVPLAYPFFTDSIHLRAKLINEKVYVPKYWSNILDWLDDNNTMAYQYAEHLIPLPIDQRYTEKDMKYIIQLIEGGK